MDIKYLLNIIRNTNLTLFTYFFHIFLHASECYVCHSGKDEGTEFIYIHILFRKMHEHVDASELIKLNKEIITVF